MIDVAIIGGGASGTILTTQLAKQSHSPLKISLIDKDAAFGKGVAYGTTNHNHILNVPAHGISADPDEPNQFLQWLDRQGIDADSNALVPRAIFHRYLMDQLNHHKSSSTDFSLDRRGNEAIAVEPEGDGEIVTLDSGDRIKARKVVLALGNSGSRWPFPLEGDNHLLGAVENPWDTTWINRVQKDDPVVIIGTGLTMVDMLITLESIGHSGAVTAISRNGNLPLSHDFSEKPFDPIRELPPKGSPVQLLRWFRKELAQHQKSGGSYRGVIDYFRPYTQSIWANWSHQEKNQFCRGLKNKWEVARHRIAPQFGEFLEQQIKSGRLKIHSGRIQKAQIARDGVQVLWQDPKDKSTKECQGRLLLNCTGPGSLYQSENPLVMQLRTQNRIAPDPLKFGIACDDSMRLLSTSGTNPHIYGIGPTLKGNFFETTAVPEIRVQGRNLAIHLLHELKNMSRAV